MTDIKDIIKGVCDALNGCFDITVYTEHVEQGLRMPCFFVYAAKTCKSRYRGRRYLAENEICIQYIPRDSACINDETDETVDKLYECTEYITAGGILLDGKKARVEKGDGFINFYVNYDTFFYKDEETAFMEELTIINEGSETA